MTGTDLIVLAPWIVFAVGLAVDLPSSCSARAARPGPAPVDRPGGPPGPSRRPGGPGAGQPP